MDGGDVEHLKNDTGKKVLLLSPGCSDEGVLVESNNWIDRFCIFFRLCREERRRLLRRASVIRTGLRLGDGVLGRGPHK